jgi:HEAT repeat protein
VAARAAGEIEISDAKERLIELLDDDNDEVRMAAAWSLSQVGGEGVQEALDMMLAETEDSEQADFIESAIDNLIFNQSVQFYGIMDYPQGKDDLDDDVYDFNEDYNAEDYEY